MLIMLDMLNMLNVPNRRYVDGSSMIAVYRTYCRYDYVPRLPLEFLASDTLANLALASY